MNSLIVHKISKTYQFNPQKDFLKKSFRDDLLALFKQPFSNEHSQQKKKTFSALQGVSFTAKKGEVIGIIGKNGGGKTTLLKIIAGITPPTNGEIRYFGKIGRILGLDIGFHPDLTGRENIFFNGVILGFRKKEIKRELGRIITFSGIEKFIDTPVKFYSSGMRVRLAFSIATAAYMEPDILLVDEILSVGDYVFQKKSFDRIKELTKNNQTTVLFVSHNLLAVQKLCARCIWFDQGEIKMIGATNEVTKLYAQHQDLD